MGTRYSDRFFGDSTTGDTSTAGTSDDLGHRLGAPEPAVLDHGPEESHRSVRRTRWARASPYAALAVAFLVGAAAGAAGWHELDVRSERAAALAEVALSASYEGLVNSTPEGQSLQIRLTNNASHAVSIKTIEFVEPSFEVRRDGMTPVTIKPAASGAIVLTVAVDCDEAGDIRNGWSPSGNVRVGVRTADDSERSVVLDVPPLATGDLSAVAWNACAARSATFTDLAAYHADSQVGDDGSVVTHLMVDNPYGGSGLINYRIDAVRTGTRDAFRVQVSPTVPTEIQTDGTIQLTLRWTIGNCTQALEGTAADTQVTISGAVGAGPTGVMVADSMDPQVTADLMRLVFMTCGTPSPGGPGAG